MKRQIIFANKRMCFPFVVGGDGYLIHNVLSYLAANGYEVLHLCPMGSFQFPLSLEQIVRSLKERKISFSINWETTTQGQRAIPYGRELTYGQNGYQCCLLDNSSFWNRLDKELQANNPTLVMTALRGAEKVLALSQSHKVPSILWVLDADQDYCNTLANHTMGSVVFDSPFLRSMFESHCRCPSYVIPPVIDLCQLPADIHESEQQFITTINPRSDKGRDIFVQIATAMPFVRFLIQEGRESRQEDFQSLENITFLQDTGDLSQCFRLTKVLLVCSTCQDAYPTVIPMAHHCGIPVIGSNRGGIPIAIGKGGVVVDNVFETQAWVAAIKQLIVDNSRLAKLRKESKKRGMQLRPERLLRRIRRVVDAVIP